MAVVVVALLAAGTSLLVRGTSHETAKPTSTFGWAGAVPKFEPQPFGSPSPNAGSRNAPLAPSPAGERSNPIMLIPPATGVPILR